MMKIYQKLALIFFTTIFMTLSCCSQRLHLTVRQNGTKKEICELDYEMANISNKLYEKFNEKAKEDVWLDISDVLEFTDIATLIEVFFPLMYESSVVINEQVKSENYTIYTTIKELHKRTKQYYSSNDTIATIALLADYFDIHEIKLIALMKIIQNLFKPDAPLKEYWKALDEFSQSPFLKALYYIQYKKALRNAFFDLIKQYLEHTQTTWQICDNDSNVEIEKIELINNGKLVVIYFKDENIVIGNVLDLFLSKRLPVKSSKITAIVSSHNGERILVGHENFVSILRKPKKREDYKQFKVLDIQSPVKSIVVDELKEQIYVITINDKIYIHNSEYYHADKRPINELDINKMEVFSDNVHKVMISANKKSLLIQKNIKTIDDETGNHSLYCLLSDLQQRQVLQNQS